jgi:2-desacetyl-2-hydroxyethyl bacteriochlorophyllide A dehydrogenase
MTEPSVNRALRVHPPAAAAFSDLPFPRPRPGEVLVRPRAVGLCGTDLELIDGVVDPAYVRYPLVLGHEWSGVVESTGPGVTGFTPGDHVVGEGIVPCGHCAPCRSGATNLCETYDEFGFTRDGAAADAIIVPAVLLHRLAGTVDLAEAALVEPASVVLRALRRAVPAPGIRALVVGDGTIGLLSAHLLGLWSPAVVDMVGRRPAQEPLAEAAGVSAFLLEPPAGNYDLVVEAAGVPESVEAAVEAAGRGGTVVLLGLAGHGRTAALPIDDLVNKDLSVLGSFAYTSSAWRNVVSLLNAGRIAPGFLITHRYPLTEAEKAIDTLRRSTGARGKIMLEIP